MAYKDIPGRAGWQFKDDPANPSNKQTALFNKQNAGIRTTGLTQVYTETKKSTDPDGKNRGEISATFYNKEVKPASFFSSLPSVGGGGGLQLSGTHSYDSTFGYCAAKLNMNTTFNTNSRNQGNVTINGALDQIMTDADFASLMSVATHITFCFEDSTTVLTLPSAQTNRAIVHTKAQIVTDPNVTQFPTTSLSTLGQTVISGYGIIWHDEDSGATLGGSDYSGLGVLLSGVATANHWGLSALGYNEVSHIGETFDAGVNNYRTYDQDIMTIWINNSGVAPVLT